MSTGTPLRKKHGLCPNPESVLQEAERVVNGDRRSEYGGAHESFKRIADLWSIALDAPVTPSQVATCMILFKVARQLNKHKRDNLVDIAGYTALLAALEGEQERFA